MRTLRCNFIKVLLIFLYLIIIGDHCLAETTDDDNFILFLPAILAKAKLPETTVTIGKDGIIRAFKGKAVYSEVNIFTGSFLTPADNNDYRYSIISGPSELLLSDKGRIKFPVESTSATRVVPISIMVSSKENRFKKTVNANILVMDTDIIASGQIGSEGGQIANEWQDVVLTVPPNAVSSLTSFELLRCIDEDGYYIFSIKSSAPVLKALHLKIPDRTLLKAPENNSTLQRKSIFDNNTRKSKAREDDNDWHEWGTGTWMANYINPPGMGATSRLRNDFDSDVGHPNIDPESEQSARLYSLCEEENYSDQCEDMTPVLFIHGYNRGFFSAGFGGGDGTWGKLPELIAEEGYAVFEFQWKTNSRFNDSADDLAEAIGLINDKSHRKIHIIAHSFGGLLSRAYLQNYATTRAYNNDVESLVTVGTPHSGIFPDTATTFENLNFTFLRGHDNVLLERCEDLTCHQAGKATPDTLKWEEDPLFGDEVTIPLHDEWFGVSETAGTFVMRIDEQGLSPGNHSMPVPVLVLMGIHLESEQYSTGDNLISFAGQRFNGRWGNETIHQDDVEVLGANIRERLLGVRGPASEDIDLDSEAVPGRHASTVLLEKWGDMDGFYHNYPAAGGCSEQDVCEVNVKTSADNSNTHEPHPTLSAINNWLNPSTPFTPPIITLNTQVVDASTQQPVSGANIYFNINGSQVSSAATFGSTDENGQLSIELPFYAFSKYTALVVKNGYHKDEFDTGYMTGLIPNGSGTGFGRLELQPDQVATGSLASQIVNATTGLAIPSVNYTLIRNSIAHTGVTDSSGNYNISDLIIGTYELRLSKTGYQNESYFVTIRSNQTNNGSVSMREILSEGQMSIRLAWDVNPGDLDSHLVKYDANGTQLYHIYYGDKTDATTGDNLDLDDTTSYGPETTTIQSVEASARYVFAVYHYSGSGSITSTSNAYISIGYGNNSNVNFNAPTSGEGRWWKVFEINNGSIIPCQSDCILNDEGLVFKASAGEEVGSTPDWLLDIMASEMPEK